ncbi:MAG: LPXTG cell wall anchor domain-containing protein, partial [Eubacterium sp.]|nr:LPXTG cell wall anchor domain-containing protein [Eubacterium sp.]
GDPILTSSLSVKESNYSSDEEMVPVTYFDESYAADLGDETYTGANTTLACLFFKRGTTPVEEVADAEEPSTEGSVFGGSGMIWIILIIVVVASGAAGAGVYFRKRKKL